MPETKKVVDSNIEKLLKGKKKEQSVWRGV